jgi:hypothetical protein
MVLNVPHLIEGMEKAVPVLVTITPISHHEVENFGGHVPAYAGVESGEVRLRFGKRKPAFLDGPLAATGTGMTDVVESSSEIVESIAGGEFSGLGNGFIQADFRALISGLRVHLDVMGIWLAFGEFPQDAIKVVNSSFGVLD